MILILHIFLILALFSNQVICSGYVEIYLKSSHRQNATVILSNGVAPTYLVLPVILLKNEEMKFGEFLIEYDKEYEVEIIIDETESLGMKKTVYHGKLNPIRGSVTPLKLNLPLTGVRFEFDCDQSWSGRKCETFCESNCSTEKWENFAELDVNYTMNSQKLESIMNALKKENEVKNSFVISKVGHQTAEEEEELIKDIMEGSGENN